ncbi:hypothetical protein DF143_37200 [Burkholderia cenocepacia]|nr:hypothetical protein DF143_37200 [Burkholderia cenocepacia]RQV32010.1 hypothetical protein DF033_36760 [Burkholderia cenocepacia]
MLLPTIHRAFDHFLAKRQRRIQAPRYYLYAPIIGAMASQARYDSPPVAVMIRGRRRGVRQERARPIPRRSTTASSAGRRSRVI